MNLSKLKKILLVGVLAIISLAVAVSFRPQQAEEPAISPSTDSSVLVLPGTTETTKSPKNATLASSEVKPVIRKETSAASALPDPVANAPSRQKVFRLILEDGECQLDAVEEVTGDFRPRRGTVDLHTGMIACRLIGANDELLAEEIVHAPDHVCAVIDPNVGNDGQTVSILAGIGPQVFQVRFPSSLAGERLEVYRITQTIPVVSRARLLTLSVTP